MGTRAIVVLLTVWCLCTASVVLVSTSAFADANSRLVNAAEKGKTARVQALLARGASANARERRSGATALILAAFSGHTDTVQALLAAGADINARQPKTSATALMMACANGHTDTIRVLLTAGADVNAQNQVGWTALMLAAKRGHRDIADALLTHNADLQVKNSQGKTALMIAKQSHHADIEQLLAQPAVAAVRRPPNNPTVVATTRGHGNGGQQISTPSGSLDPNTLGNYYALVIGINDYAYIPRLKTAVDDATTIAQLLEQHYNFNVRLLLNATREEIIGAFDALRATLTVQDNLVIYYAGHGHLDKDSDRGYWLPVNAKEHTRIHWVSNADITDTLKALNSKHVLVVSDSCYSGTLTRGLSAVNLKTATARDTYLIRMAKKRSRTVLTSGGLEPVLDSGGGKHSVFAQAFMDALRDNNDILEGQQLFYTIRQQVRTNAEQSPVYDDIRFTGHQGGGDFLFVRKR